MLGFDRSDDYQPLTYIGGRPFYVTTLLVLLHVVALITGCISMAANWPGVFEVAPNLDYPGFMGWFGFFSTAVLKHGAIWQFFTYAFVHSPSIMFLLDMVFLYLWGQEVERYFGRRVFITLYLALLLTPPLLLTGLGLLTGRTLSYMGSDVLHFAVFIAFVTVYPNVQFFFGLLAKWIAWALLAIWTLAALASRDVVSLMILWSSVSVAYFGTRYAGAGGGGFSILENLRDRFPRKQVSSGVKPRLKPRRVAAETLTLNEGGVSTAVLDVHESIDPLLDKISKHGLASLTNSERAALERARVSLLRKERGG